MHVYTQGRKGKTDQRLQKEIFFLDSNYKATNLGIPLEFLTPSEIDFVRSCLTITDPSTHVPVAQILSRVKLDCKRRGYFITRTKV